VQGKCNKSGSKYVDLATKYVHNEGSFNNHQIVLLIIFINFSRHDKKDVIPTAPTVALQRIPDDEISHSCVTYNCMLHFTQTSNMRLNLVARGMDMMAAPSATPNTR
jgi:hypothetical protein